MAATRKIVYADDVFAALMKNGWGCSDAANFVKSIRTADAAPVVHGRWIVDVSHLRATCSECGKILRFSDEMQIDFLRDEEHFCYFCGAQMETEG